MTVTTAEGVSPMDTLSQSTDPFISNVFPDVQTGKSLLDKLAEVIAENAPMTGVQALTWAMKEGKDNPEIRAFMDQLRQVEEQAKELRTRMVEKAKELNASEGTLSTEDEAAAREKFASVKNDVVNKVKAMEAYVQYAPNVDADTKAAVKALAERPAPNLRGGSTPAATNNNQVIREWARANGYDVNDRGRISEEIVAAYNRAN